MMEVIVFALTLVIAQTVVGLILTAVFASKWFVQKVMKKTIDFMEEFDSDQF